MMKHPRPPDRIWTPTFSERTVPQDKFPDTVEQAISELTWEHVTQDWMVELVDEGEFPEEALQHVKVLNVQTAVLPSGHRIYLKIFCSYPKLNHFLKAYSDANVIGISVVNFQQGTPPFDHMVLLEDGGTVAPSLDGEFLTNISNLDAFVTEMAKLVLIGYGDLKLDNITISDDGEFRFIDIISQMYKSDVEEFLEKAAYKTHTVFQRYADGNALEEITLIRLESLAETINSNRDIPIPELALSDDAMEIAQHIDNMDLLEYSEAQGNLPQQLQDDPWSEIPDRMF